MDFTIFVYLLLICSLSIVKSYSKNGEIDASGYILYCPCMGRFGNQADQFLGSLAFARGLNRTLVLPPWVEYRNGAIRSIQIPFNKYFDIEALNRYHRIVAMEKFMDRIAPHIWPEQRRIAFCYMHRDSLRKNSEISCNAKDGNPFESFWNTFHVNFIGSEFFGPLQYDSWIKKQAEQWMEKYPPDKWPVLAFTGAPASFPVKKENVYLHKYLQWSKDIKQKAETFIATEMNGRRFIGIHLRNGIDWINACEHIKNSPNLFSAPQCLGYHNEMGAATIEMCMPNRELIVKKIRQIIIASKQIPEKEIQSIFVASDSNHMLDDLNSTFHGINVLAFKYPESNPHVDLAILGMSTYFIANCISSFSAFAVRERQAKGLPNSFWGFSNDNKISIQRSLSDRREEL